jgi:hypothetical protein
MKEVNEKLVVLFTTHKRYLRHTHSAYVRFYEKRGFPLCHFEPNLVDDGCCLASSFFCSDFAKVQNKRNEKSSLFL